MAQRHFNVRSSIQRVSIQFNNRALGVPDQGEEEHPVHNGTLHVYRGMSRELEDMMEEQRTTQDGNQRDSDK
jgi:hypothetical protein